MTLVSPQHHDEQRVIILAPVGKDAELARTILTHAGLHCECCTDLFQVCAELTKGASSLLIVEEAITATQHACLDEWLTLQPSWSDLPILVLARPGADSSAVARAIELLGNVTVLERPIRIAALVSAVRTALRSRQRQYEARARITEIELRDRDLHDFFDNAAVGMHCAGPDGTILRVNQTELELLGYTREEYIGHNIAEFHADPAVINAILLRLHNGETIREAESRLRCKDGTFKDVVINTNVLWKDGRFIHTRCFTRDITDRKKAQEAQSLLAAIVASSDDAIISKTLEGRILTWNAGAERVFGYTAAEAIGQSITMLIPEERQSEEPSLLNRLRRGERVEHFETVRLTKDGRRIDIALTVSPIRDSTGKIIGASKVARDITDRKLAEKALQTSRAELQFVTETTPLILVRCSRDLRYKFMNRAAAALYGLTPRDMVGRSIEEMIDPMTFASVKPWIDRVLNGETVEYETQITYPHAGQRWVRVNYLPDRDKNGVIVGWLASVTDITDRKQAEESLREADRRKDEFLAVLAHELRNPLAPIRNSLHILRMAGSHDTTTERVSEMLERQVNHMVRLVDDLMEVSRITRGKIQLKNEYVEVASIVRSALEASRPFVEAAGHQLAVAMPSEPVSLTGDPVRLTQIISNLLNNAAKYTPRDGQIWLTIRRDENWLSISVRDTGIGIAPEMLPRVFDLFTQVDRHANRAQGGLGIGLTLVKRLAEMHGGEVTALSPGIGHGSEFIVRLPIAVDALPVKRPDDVLLSAPTLSAKRVLVVDDNQDAAESLAFLLRILGADVRTVYNGADALQALPEFRPNAVLLDIGMPEMDGHEVARRIRQQHEFDDVALIALTGWGQPQDRDLSRSVGFDHHLIKPADVNALQTLLLASPDSK